jgi:hypothetical protein
MNLNLFSSITDDYFDNQTHEMLFKRLTNEQIDSIEKQQQSSSKETLAQFLFKRWSTIVCGLSANYTIQYGSLTTAQERNAWFQKYLDYPTKDMSEMPEYL